MAAGLLFLLPLAVLLPLALVVLVVLAVTARPDAEVGAATAAARRHAVTGGVLAVVAAVGAAACWVALVRSADGPAGGRLLAGVLLVAAAAHTAVLALTEVTWPRPTGLRRSGLLVRRGVRDVAPRLLTAAVVGAGAGIALTAAAGVLAADGTGRALTRSWTAGDGSVLTQSAGPFPGAYYAVPVLLGTAGLGVLVLLTLRLVVARPAVAGAHPDADDALRRASAHRVLRGAASGLGLTLAALLAVAGQAVPRVAESSGGREALGLALVVTASVVGLASVLVLAVPAPRVPHPAPAPVPVPGAQPA